MNIPTSRLPLEDEDVRAVIDVYPDGDRGVVILAFLAIAFCGALVGALLVGVVWWLT